MGEKPNGDSSTSAPMSIARWMAARVDARTMPLCMKSTPSTMPTGRAVRKLPETTRTVALAIGVFGRPCENAASISKRNWPAASCAQSSATASVMRMPWLKRDAWPLAAQLLVHLRPEAVHEHQLDAHRVQDREVLHEGIQLAGGDQLAGHRDDEGLAAVSVDVRRDRAEPRNEGVRKHEAHGRATPARCAAPPAPRRALRPSGHARSGSATRAFSARAISRVALGEVIWSRSPSISSDRAAHFAAACRPSA